MAETTKIEWTDATFNPWVGCTKVSPACDHCYAEGWAKRSGAPELWQGARRRTTDAYWKQPLKWNAESPRKYGRRTRVFCASLADVFDNQVPTEWRDALWNLIDQTPNLDWLLLTKRPQNIAKMLPASPAWPWPNVWLGTTVENQIEAERRIPGLLSVPAHRRFLSCEPLLGPLDLTNLCTGHYFVDALTGVRFHDADNGAHEAGPKLSWVIAGGESGPGARPAMIQWVRSLRDQCARAGTDFHFKQWGEFTPDDPAAKQTSMQRVGKKRAGRLLDGVEHNGFPI
jgi:protein gp37